MTKKYSNNHFIYYANIIIALCLYIILFKFTPNGLGTSADSVGYIKAAKGLVGDHGFDFFTNVWPPLYSLLLASFGLIFDGDVIYGGRVLNSLIWSINYLLFYKLISKLITNKFFVIILAILMATHPLTVGLHLYAWTEPLFTTFFVVNILLLERIINSKTLLNYLITISVLGGLSLMLRYAGVSIIIGNIVTFFIFHLLKAISYKKFMICIGTQIIIPFVICLPWYIYVNNRFNNLTGTNFVLNRIDVNKILDGISTIGTWIINVEYLKSLSIYGSLSLAAGVIIVISIYRAFIVEVANYKFNKLSLPIISSLSFISYSIFIVFSSSFINVATPLDNRILSPVFPLVLFQLVSYISALQSKVKQILILLILMFFVSNSVSKFKGSMYFSAFNGFEYSNPKLKESNIISLLKNCPSSTRIYSDTPWALNLYIPAHALWLPRKYIYTSGLLNPNYDSELKSLNFLGDIVFLVERDGEYSKALSKMTFIKKYDGLEGEVWVNINYFDCVN